MNSSKLLCLQINCILKLVGILTSSVLVHSFVCTSVQTLQNMKLRRHVSKQIAK